MSIFKQTWLLLGTALALLNSSNATALAQDIMPDAVKIHLQQAEQQYFDGEYEEALRALHSAQKWIDKSSNRKTIHELGHDHGILRAYLMGLKAEVYAHRGDETKALSALRTADSLSKPRRVYWTRLGNPPIRLWQFEAFLKLVEGDIFRPIPDYGLTSEMFLPAALHGTVAKRADPAKALTAYNEAEAILSNSFVLRNADSYLRRLRGRLMVSRASTSVAKRGLPAATDITDSREYLSRAEELFSESPVWQLCLSADASLPLTYKELEEKTKGNEELKTDLKRLFGQAIQDWLALKLGHLELEAIAETSSDEPGVVGVSATEKEFSRVYHFCHAQFPSTHPTLAKVLLSRARWYFYLASDSLRAVDEQSVKLTVSLFRDCAFEVNRLRGTHELTYRQNYEVSVLEIAALRGILATEEHGFELSAQETQRVRERIEHIENLLQALDAQPKTTDAEESEKAISSSDE